MPMSCGIVYGSLELEPFQLRNVLSTQTYLFLAHTPSVRNSCGRITSAYSFLTVRLSFQPERVVGAGRKEGKTVGSQNRCNFAR